jgi:PAS domain S-box-containing protein
VSVVVGRGRPLVLVAVAALVVLLLAHALLPSGRVAGAPLAALAATGSTLVALVAGALAWRRVAEPERRTWLIVALGCAGYLAGELVATAYALTRHVPPPYPSLADLGKLSIYVALVVAVVDILRSSPHRRVDPEVTLDTGLVTYTASALTYEFLVAPLAGEGEASWALLTSLAWATAGAGLLLMVLILMVRRSPGARARLGLLFGGFALFGVTDIGYAALRAGGRYQAGGLIDLGWDIGFLTIAVAAALAPAHATPPPRRTGASTGGRALGIPLALAGIGGIAVEQALSPERDLAAAVLVIVGMVLVGARFVYSLRADRRYASLLENEVASQTRSLMDSLAGTAAAERHLRLVMEAVPDAVVVLDREGHILESNGPARILLGVTDAAGRHVFDLFDADIAGVVRDKMEEAFRGDVQRFETRFRRPDGTRGLAAMLYAPVREGSAIPRILALARDVTDQKRTEAQLQQAEKLTAIAHLVSGVAHEINNPAAIILGFAQTLLLDELKPEHREMLEMVGEEAGRIGRITSNLLAFARAGGKQRTLVDLNDIVRRTFALRSYHLSTLNIAVTLELDAAEPKCWADPSELQQMLLNLLINAEQALVSVESRRAITVRTRSSEHEVVLELADSGPGIAPEVRGKVFDPFFTTKPEGVGTGLGLSICYGIAQDHGGHIAVESEPGHGARFWVTLPRDPRHEARTAPIAVPPVAPLTGVLTVLVVDDETALRNALLRFLDRRGIRGRGVADGVAALELLRQAEFDVIISDVRMPGMSGREFLEGLRRDRPDLVARLVFATGDTFAPETAALIRDAGVPTVTKPFDFAALEQVLRQVAAAARQGAAAPTRAHPRFA